MAVFAIAFFRQEKLPDSRLIWPQLYNDARQTETAAKPFKIAKDKFTAEIEPVYDYELHGLIVADYDAHVWHDITHKNDPFNTKDICVIWGSNLKDNLYHDFKFTHGEFTCFYQTNSATAYRNFSEDKLSNNHLLLVDETIEKIIKQAKIGDQVKLGGQLVNYRVSGPERTGGSRNSSISRVDRGNGACEVVLVNDFTILQTGNPLWSLAYKYSSHAIWGCLAVWLLLFIFEIISGWRTGKEEGI